MKWYTFVFLAIAFSFVACQSYDDYYPEEEEVEVNTENGEQPLGEEGELTLYRVNGESIEKMWDYQVGNQLLPYQQDYSKHLDMWDFTRQLIPEAFRDKIARFEVFYGYDELQGYVFPVDENDLSQWTFALAIEAAEDLESIDFNALFTLVTLHEYGHVLTLNDDQVNVNEGAQSCSTYHTGEGCSHNNAYINRFFDLGWADIYDEINENRPEKLYQRYPDRFVTEYAATNPGEDIAEVFSLFVIQEQPPTGQSLADQKIRMLYDFPELVTLRNAIRENVPEGMNNIIHLRSQAGKFKVCGRAKKRNQ